MTRTPACPGDEVLVLRGLSLLDGADREGVDRHLGSCPRCAARVASFDRREFGSELTEVRGHVPATVLARRPDRIAELSPRSRAAIASHLGRCATCREEAAVVGRLRALPAAPAERPARPRVHRLLAGYAALATAAALVFALRGPLVDPGSAPAPAPTRGPAAAPVPAPVATATPSPVPGPAAKWSVNLVPRAARPLAPTMRGAGTAGRITRAAERGVLLVRVEPLLDAGDAAVVVVELLDRDARILSRSQVRARELHGGREFLIVGAGTAALPTGTYTLRFRTEPSGEAAGDSIDYPFELEGEG